MTATFRIQCFQFNLQFGHTFAFLFQGGQYEPWVKKNVPLVVHLSIYPIIHQQIPGQKPDHKDGCRPYPHHSYTGMSTDRFPAQSASTYPRTSRKVPPLVLPWLTTKEGDIVSTTRQSWRRQGKQLMRISATANHATISRSASITVVVTVTGARRRGMLSRFSVGK